jgi:F420-dependent oxidoreductase-like protein
MELRIFTEPQQGATYDTLLAVAKAAETLGFGAFFRSDHYAKMGSVSGLPGPTDAWITLAGLARDTSTIRLGTLVNSATFRMPGPLAISVAQVDAMSNGRVELGLGAGWFQAEHDAYGIPFPSVAERFEKLEEQLAIVTGLWSATGLYNFAGKHYTLKDSPALPKPVQPTLPIIIGGGGPKKTPRLAATYAAEFNSPFASVETTAERYANVRNACEAIGRDPKTMTWSVAQIIVCGRTDAEIAKRAAAVGREVPELRENGLCGTPEEIVKKLQQWGSIGVNRAYLQIMDLHDLEHIQLIADAVLPHAAAF